MTSQRFATTYKRAGFRAGVAAGLAVALLAAGSSAVARPRPELPEHTAIESLRPAQRGGGVTLAQASSMAQSRYQGRVVRAETVQVGDRRVHEIRILGEDGRVHIVRIDAETGAFL
jgi:hypothetical protein